MKFIEKKTARSLIELSGKAKSVKYQSYKVITNTNSTENRKEINKIFSNCFGYDLSNMHFTFNNNGEIIEHEELQNNEKITYKRKYKIRNGKKQLLNTYFYYKGFLLYSNTLIYDEKGYLIRLETFDNNGHIMIVNSYSTESNYYTIKRKSCSSNGKILKDVKYQYNHQGLLIKVDSYFYGEDLCNRYDWIFDDTPPINKNLESSMHYHYDYRYNEHNELIETYTEFPNTIGKSLNFNFKYAYNEQNDWIKKIYYSNDKAIYIIIRDIEYF